jgi:hypothetical protein
MAAELLSPQVSIEELEPKIRNIVGVATSVVGFVGVAERGPIGVATLCTGFEMYQAKFGGYTANADMTVGVQEAFRLGAREVWIVRTVHYTDPASAGTKTSAAGTLTLQTASLVTSKGIVTGSVVGPFVLAHGDTLVGSVSGAGNQTATFNGVAAARECATAEPYNFSGGKTLTVAIDGGAVQTITFVDGNFVTPTAATAEEVVAVINGQIVGAQATVTTGGTKVTITSDRKGTSSGVNVTSGTANALLNFTTGNVAGSGNVANIAAVTVAEVKTIVEAAWTSSGGVTVTNVGGAVRIETNNSGGAVSILVVASSTADDELGLDNATHSGVAAGAQNTLQVDGKTDGAYANGLRIKIAAPTSGISGEFNLVVLNASSQELESFQNLSMVSTAPRYCLTVVNSEIEGSNLIKLTDLAATAPVPDNSPNAGTFGPLTGGNDGLGSLADNDFIGAAAGSTGLYALNTVTNLTLLAMPARSSVAAVANAMIVYCEVTRNKSVFSVLDCPANQTIAQMKTYVGTLNASEFASLYYPRVKILNPSKSVYGNSSSITIPPSGPVVGVICRTDAARVGGIYDSPAGLPEGVVNGVLGLESEMINDLANYNILYPLNVNGIRAIEGGGGFYIDGVRTLKRTGLFPSITERRGAMFIERSIQNGLLFAKFKPHTEDLRTRIVRVVTRFLAAQMALGAFASTVPEEAFYVKCDEELNTPDVIANNQVIVRIGLAMAKPAEFIRLQFTADTRALDAALAVAP